MSNYTSLQPLGEIEALVEYTPDSVGLVVIEAVTIDGGDVPLAAFSETQLMKWEYAIMREVADDRRIERETAAAKAEEARSEARAMDRMGSAS